MKITSDYLYDLLPAYHRTLDQERGGQLAAFINVLAQEAGVVEKNIDQLYENWFIETCDEWVVPYIGELLGVRGVHQINENQVFSRRAYVANTLAYRRRKGTAPIIEQLALDTTGWRARVVEFFQRLVTTQNLNHLRLSNHVTPDLNQMEATDLIGSPFEQAAHIVDVGRISQGEGRYNIMNLGIYVWRLNAYPLSNVEAFPMPVGGGIPAGAYTFNPLGLDIHLFNYPKSETTITSLAKEINVPGLLRRRGLHEELVNFKVANINPAASIDDAIQHLQFLHPERPVFSIYRNGVIVPTEEVVICNLSNWHQPAASRTYEYLSSANVLNEVPLAVSVAVDPVLGRFVVNDPVVDEIVLVNYNYGFSSDLGGGPYDRNQGDFPKGTDIDWQVGVSRDITAVGSEVIHSSLAAAIAEWNGLPPSADGRVGLITLMDSRTYDEAITGTGKIEIPPGDRLYILAADWPALPDPAGGIGQFIRPMGQYEASGVRPHIRTKLEVEGTSIVNGKQGGTLGINGVLIEGQLHFLPGNLGSCLLEHTTIVPGQGGILIDNQTDIFSLNLSRAISGGIQCLSEDAQLTVSDSLVDEKDSLAVDAVDANCNFQSSTFWGGIVSQQLDASNCIFNDMLDIRRRQSGCIRFSFVPDVSISPRRYRCQPDSAIQVATQDLTDISEISIARQAIVNYLKPTFNANTYGHHAYGQLASACPIEIFEGADNGAEMGASYHLQQPQRLSNLKIALDEYLRLGLEAGVIFMT